MFKGKQSQNLIPQQVILKRVQSLLVPAVLVMVVVTLIVTLSYQYGCQMLNSKFKEDAVEVEKNSAYTEMLKLQGDIDTVNTEIADLTKKVKNSGSIVEELTTAIEDDTRIQEISNFLITSVPANVTLIMIEDVVTGEMYSKSNVDTMVEEYEKEMMEREEDLLDPDETEEVEVNTEEVVGYNPDVLNNNGSGLSDQLIVRGFALDMALLSEYIETLKDCEVITGYVVNAIEAIEITDYSIYLFELLINF